MRAEGAHMSTYRGPLQQLHTKQDFHFAPRPAFFWSWRSQTPTRIRRGPVVSRDLCAIAEPERRDASNSGRSRSTHQDSRRVNVHAAPEEPGPSMNSARPTCESLDMPATSTDFPTRTTGRGNLLDIRQREGELPNGLNVHLLAWHAVSLPTVTWTRVYAV
jgi:hypothetical protein